ncbi:ATPase, partial [Micromonospora chalcea]
MTPGLENAPTGPCFVGRGAQLARIGKAQAAALGHGRQMVCEVVGEPGIGKTRFVREALERCAPTVPWAVGTCAPDERGVPFHVFRHALTKGQPPRRGLRAGRPAPTWAEPAGAVPPASDARRFRTYQAARRLIGLAARDGLVVVLDDLHWADPASVRLLQFVTRHTWFERLLFVGTYRDAEVESGEHPLRPLLVPLSAKATTVTLTGLGRDDVAALMTRTAGREPGADLVAEVHRRTGGNPFFVEQTARLWHTDGLTDTIAPGVREVVRRRLDQLTAPVVEALTVAAVLGHEFDRGTVAACVP